MVSQSVLDFAIKIKKKIKHNIPTLKFIPFQDLEFERISCTYKENKRKKEIESERDTFHHLI